MKKEKVSSGESVSVITTDQIRGAVHLGLMTFWRKALPADQGLTGLLKKEASRLLEEEDPVWDKWRDRLDSAWQHQSGALGRLVSDFDLDLPQTFLLTLVGEVEASHIINLTVSELQAPDKSARPTLHLCVAMIESLFSSPIKNALDIANVDLVRKHVLTLEGSGPMPLRHLSTHPSLWSILQDKPYHWPNCYPISKATQNVLPKQVVSDVPKFTTLISKGDMNGILIRGTPDSGRAFLAAELAQAMSLTAVEIPVPVWENQPVLGQACRYAGWLPVLRPNLGPGEVWRPPMGDLPSPMVVLLGTDGAVETADFLELEPHIPNQQQRRALWQEALGDEKLAGRMAGSALLSGSAIRKVAANANLLAKRENKSINQSHIAEARKGLGVERLRLLAQPVHHRVTEKALVLPSLVEENIDALILRTRRRESLWRGLGATLKATPNPGVRALFVGESGTGKTLAASYIATKLGAPLYRVDLSAVMNKYIGESEKNLAALLDQATTSDVVLLFDEADALFGSRTEGKETGERYANMLTNFLLTRIENHPGLVLLTTNSRNRIDNAFTRRIDFIVEFPLPGFKERFALWCSHLGDRGPGEQIYCLLASYCDFAGGQIRNVVLAAATQARGKAIGEEHLISGLQAEYRKIGRDLPAKLALLGHPQAQVIQKTG